MYTHLSFQQQWHIQQHTWFQLGECSAMVSLLSNTPLLPEIRQEMHKVSLVKGAQATTAIEGNTLEEEDVARIQEGWKLPPSQKYLEQEVRNILDALNALLQTVIIGKTDSLINKDLLLRFHHMIGKDLGSAFDAIPGKFRMDNRVVGPYRPPDYQNVPDLITRLCTWLRDEFHYSHGQDFPTAVIQAIVAHVYIEWIHPFADGNGRTGRLVEFYILLRAGLPSIVSHIMSNFYNLTRQEYYRQLNEARLKNDLSGFIAYAVQGFRDGLEENIRNVQQYQYKVFWDNYIHETMSALPYVKKATMKRQRNLMLQFPLGRELDIQDIRRLSVEVARDYASLTPTTLKRDLDLLEKTKLLIRTDKKYQANSDILKVLIPIRKGQA